MFSHATRQMGSVGSVGMRSRPFRSENALGLNFFCAPNWTQNLQKMWVLYYTKWFSHCERCSRKSGPFLAWDTLRMCGKRENMKPSSWVIQKFDAPECSPLVIEKISWMVVKPAVDGLLPCCSPNVFLNAILRVSPGENSQPSTMDDNLHLPFGELT